MDTSNLSESMYKIIRLVLIYGGVFLVAYVLSKFDVHTYLIMFIAVYVDRAKVKSRASVEAKRQASNPEIRYSLTPMYQNALGILLPYFSSDIDFKGIIESGVSTIDVKSRLEIILRKVRREHKDNGTIYASTLKEYENIFYETKENTAEEKEVSAIEISLYYTGA